MKITEILVKKKTKLEEEIERILDEMQCMDADSNEYEAAINNLTRLYELNSKEKKSHISPDTMAVVAGNLLGIILILKHEEFNVITSKAMNFVIKGRV